MFTGERRGVLLDTCFFLALQNNDDVNHEKAIDLSERLASEGAVFWTTDYVLDEAITFAIRQTGSRKLAIEVAQLILAEDHVHLEWMNESRVRRSFAAFKKYDDKKFSFTDCSLIVLAQAEGFEWIVSFDEEFKKITDGPRVIDC